MQVIPLESNLARSTWAFFVSGAFLLIALIAPALLHPINILWDRLGRLLAKVTNPLITALMFYVVITPAAFILRVVGKDILRLKMDPGSNTYWISRVPPGPPRESMPNQF